MQRKNVIVVISEEVEVFGNFKKMCEVKGFPYHSLKMLKFPITYKDSIIYKVEFKQRLTFKLHAGCGLASVNFLINENMNKNGNSTKIATVV